MTREEAKKILQNSRKELIDYKGVNNSSAEALYIAIKSLEAWDAVRAEIDTYLFKNEFGTAYRQEVADIIDKHLQEVDS
jgi:hypothetical protein